MTLTKAYSSTLWAAVRQPIETLSFLLQEIHNEH